MINCSTCKYGPRPDPFSDICDGCRNDGDTGFVGFTDGATGKHHMKPLTQNDISLFDDDDDSEE